MRLVRIDTGSCIGTDLARPVRLFTYEGRKRLYEFSVAQTLCKADIEFARNYVPPESDEPEAA